MELRNPFGLRNNQIILIEDIPKSENGLRCNCVCPACKEPFEARMGNIRRHHFAHSGQGCDEINAYLTGLYMLLTEYLTSGQQLYVPPVIVAFDLSAHYYCTEENINDHTRLLSVSQDKDHEICLYESKRVRFTSAVIVKDTKDRPKAVLADLHGRKLAFRITPPDTVCKLGTVSQYQDYPTIELDLSHAADMLQTSRKDAVFQYLLKEHSIYRWINNPKISEAFPQIMKRSKAYYNAAQIRIKKEEEQRKAEAARRADEARKRIEEQSKIQGEILQQRIVERQRKEHEWKRRQDEARALREEKIRHEKEEKYALGLSDVRELFTQQENIIRDRFGNRWVKCEGCGKIKQDFEFASYGGLNHINLGTCKECSRKHY